MSASQITIGEIAEQIRGVTYDKADAIKVERAGYLPILRAGNISEDGMIFEDLVFVPQARVSEKQRLRIGDILIAASSGSLDVVGKAAMLTSSFKGSFGAFCKTLRVKSSNAYPAYIAHYFRTKAYRSKISSLAAGANINNLRNEHLDGLVVPLPPLPEQRRIAAILDKADALRAKRRATLIELDGLAQAIFLEMFGDPVANEHGWHRQSLESVAKIQIGPFGSLLHQADYVSGGVPLINPMHIVSGSIQPDSEYSVTDAKREKLSLYLIRPGDVVMGRRGEMGRCAVADEQHDGLICGTGSLLIRPNPELANAQYLAATISSTRIRRKLEELSLGATLPNLNAGLVSSLIVNMPPVALQSEFVRRLGTLAALRAKALTGQQAAEQLFSSLQNRAFRGEL